MRLLQAAPKRRSWTKPFSFATNFTFATESKLMLKIIFDGLHLARGSFHAGQTGRGTQTGFEAVCAVPAPAQAFEAARGDCCSSFSTAGPVP